ncbi:Ornithine decarboxylase [Coemansia sp. RSA 552]|nr:Ornithine decarboxylase [Coemansia sp. RSA 552]
MHIPASSPAPVESHAKGAVSKVESHAKGAVSEKTAMVSEKTALPHPCVERTLRARVARPDAEDAFFVADLGEVRRQLAAWRQALGRVQPFFAVKCNPDPRVVRLLAQLGAGFDCASRAELQQVLSEGVGTDDVIYAHPCKPASHLRYARAAGVRLMTFDNADELAKMSQLFPGARAVLRILADDSAARCQLGLKFGADPAAAPALLDAAQRLGVDVVGVSFHVGSGSSSAAAFADAVARARRVFDQAAARGLRLQVLDVGGGFAGRGDDGLPFAAAAGALSDALDAYFPPTQWGHVRIIAEPGRFFVASAFSLAVNVVARRAEADRFMYYVNDGVYGSFNCIIFDHQHPQARVLHPRPGPLHAASVWGPTCDSIDCVVPATRLPELCIGDWLVFDSMGAYTVCAASRFNGFGPPAVEYVDSEAAADI